jgi:hypothetical protein
MMRPIPDYDNSRANLTREEHLALVAEARQVRAEAAAEAFAAAGRWLKRLFTGLADAHRRRKAYAELSSLDDRMLRDMGLNRGELWAAVDGRAGLHASNDNLGVVGAANENRPHSEGQAA